jgi:hypothetical protein
MIDGGLLQNAAKMKLGVLFAMHFKAEVWRLITHTTMKKHILKYSFSIFI